MKSWTIQFFKEWSSRTDLLSIPGLRRRVLRNARGESRPGRTFVLPMKRPIAGLVRLRECGSDIQTLNEVALLEIYKSVVSAIPAPRAVIDLGANVGLASLYFAYHWPSCRILAVEPNPETYDILVENLAPLTRSGRCKTLQAAAWGFHAELCPVADQRPGAFDGYTLQEAAISDDEGCKIIGMAMPEIIEYSGFDNIDLLKIDIEGAEARLFRENTGWLEHVSSIAIEFHGEARAVSKFDEVTEMHGFRLRTAEQHTILVSKGTHGQITG
ncbi:MAG TPA: FkbM family methyltransferase [Terriglobia bacterium]|nr:FkbM family methyltransferase [Terriglobia bacterium]